MKNFTILLVLFLFGIISACKEDPQALLREATDKLKSSKSVQYQQTGLFPNPSGQIDTINTVSTFVKKGLNAYDYDFVIKSDLGGLIQIDGEWKLINQYTKQVVKYPENRAEIWETQKKSSPNFKHSPLVMLQEKDWVYLRDTVLNNNSLKNYFFVENDKVVDGNKVYTEQHIFINPQTKLVERWARLNYYKNKLSQIRIVIYSNYILSSTPEKLTFTNPPGYTSTVYTGKKVIKHLEVGQEAPFFKIDDLQNKEIDLEDYRGKKILLNFSSVGCGYCKDALQLMNANDYKLADNIQAFYLSIQDQNQLDKVKYYFEKMPISYPVIPEADKIAELYGAASTPNFFLIDEEGLIEKVVIGFDKDFLMTLAEN
ncbi:TlpA family protein disulfide reductase [Marivirga arenosa]|uniref:TlpA disulfide reductase family protein n=1 Tax=Marivirga arenosa TaxID=3059076 RepID=A0AA51X4X7_9BACT|nr:TlpA disulfide reductase family protein [Marivirga sp. BKB1-2]WNB17221.1 TlpA disulfide reductase family protein [Marivirga sp. BKB1-2]